MLKDMDQQWEYVTVQIPPNAPKGQRLDDVISQELNAVAAHGWRLHSVIPGGQFGGGQAVFERPAR